MLIGLTKSLSAQIDDADWPLVSGRKWCAEAHRGTKWYARNRDGYMHRVIMGAQAGQIIDHINHNGLDNRRCNLRFVSPSENHWHSRRAKNNTTGFIGVHFDKTHGRWKASVMRHGHRHYLGYFNNPVDAALAHDLAALQLHGEYAETNFPKEDYGNVPAYLPLVRHLDGAATLLLDLSPLRLP